MNAPKILESWPCGCRIEEPCDKTRYADRVVICSQHASGPIAMPKWREIIYSGGGSRG